MLKLSICIPTYNRTECLDNCLNSILIAKKNYDTEIDKLKISKGLVNNNRMGENTLEALITKTQGAWRRQVSACPSGEATEIESRPCDRATRWPPTVSAARWLPYTTSSTRSIVAPSTG